MKEKHKSQYMKKVVVEWVGQSYSIQCNACNGATAARLPSAEVSIMGKVLVQVRSCSKHLGEVRPSLIWRCKIVKDSVSRMWSFGILVAVLIKLIVECEYQVDNHGVVIKVVTWV